MFKYYVLNKEKKDKIIDFFIDKKVKYFLTEQFCITRVFDCDNYSSVEMSTDRNFVYMFEWDNKKIKKEHLMALWVIMIEKLIENLNSKNKTIYDRIHGVEEYSMSKNIVKMTCNGYADIYMYSSNLVYRNIKELDISVNDYRNLVDIISYEFNRILLFCAK